MLVGLPDSREGQVKYRDKTAQFQRALKGNFYCLSLNGKNTPHFTILTPKPFLILELSQKTPKTMFLNNFFNISSILNLSLPLILG